MSSKHLNIDSARHYSLKLDSTIYEHTDICLYFLVSLCGEDEAIDLSKEKSIELVQLLVGHFNKNHNLSEEQIQTINNLFK